MKLILLTIAIALLIPSLGNIDLEQKGDDHFFAMGRREPTVDELMDTYFGDVKVAAYKVFKCESGMRPKAINHNTNGSTDRGIAQINSVHARKVNGDLDSLFEPKVNLKVARQIYNASGWNPWVCAGKVL